MKIKNMTRQEIQVALDNTNQKFNGNIEFNRFDSQSVNRHTVTLKVKNSSGAGARRGFQINNDGSRRKLVSACWHVHSEFIDACLDFRSNVTITSYMSELCEC